MTTTLNRPETRDNMPTSETDTVTYVISTTQAKQLAALHFCASKDQARPVLTSVNLSYSPDELKGTVTDSYRLVERSFVSEDDANNAKKNKVPTVWRSDVGGTGSVLVNAKAFKDALTTAGKVTGAHLPDHPTIRLTIGERLVTVETGLASSPTRFSVPTLDATFPQTDSFWENVPDVMGNDMKHLAFHPGYLWDIARATGKTQAQMKVPMTVKASTELKPIHITMGEEGFRALLMPVRI